MSWAPARHAPETGAEIGRVAIPDWREIAGRRRFRFGSPLLRRILLVNALPLALLVAALLYLDQYQNGLLEAEVSALREQARIYAGALGESERSTHRTRSSRGEASPVEVAACGTCRVGAR